MLKILKYTLFDLLRSRWTYLYFLFYFVFASALFIISGDLAKVVISLMNVILILCPLIATMFGAMYYYNSREFIELLLAQPLNRSEIFIGQYLGITLSLSLSLLLGIGIPFAVYGFAGNAAIWDFLVLMVDGVFLSFIFCGLAFLIALSCENKIRGFGLAILVWLFFAIIYDGIFLLLLIWFRAYPLEKLSIAMAILNPIDLSRILVLLKLDISALMGYTGAVFQKFMGTGAGMAIAFTALILWILIPIWCIKRLASKKDF